MRVGRFDVNVETDWRSINRPHFVCDWIDRGVFLIGVSWGNGNSDPVWLFDLIIDTRRGPA